jgi:hypothetical protein
MFENPGSAQNDLYWLRPGKVTKITVKSNRFPVPQGDIRVCRASSPTSSLLQAWSRDSVLFGSKPKNLGVQNLAPSSDAQMWTYKLDLGLENVSSTWEPFSRGDDTATATISMVRRCCIEEYELKSSNLAAYSR